MVGWCSMGTFNDPWDGLEMVELSTGPIPQDWWVSPPMSSMGENPSGRAGWENRSYPLSSSWILIWFDSIYEYRMIVYALDIHHSIPCPTKKYNSATCQAFIPRIGWRYLGGSTCKSIHPLDFAHFCPKWIPLFSSQQLEHPAAVPDVPGAPADEDPRLLTPEFAASTRVGISPQIGFDQLCSRVG